MTNTAASSTSTPKTITASRTGGRSVIGGGFSVSASAEPGEFTPSVSQPTAGNDGWTATVNEDNAAGGTTWSLTAYALCATATP